MLQYNFCIDLVRSLETAVWNDSNAARREHENAFIEIRKLIYDINVILHYGYIGIDEAYKGNAEYNCLIEKTIFQFLFAINKDISYLGFTKNNLALTGLCFELDKKLKLLQMSLQNNDATTGDYI